ncbi:phosphotransferase [Novosphingobium mathurense]|uniref:Hydroxylysine kinase n=1 Tax=Novosphingobium mathurense TaxID=428990 RepID=A0A1U6HTZ1_9SPHN|nr:phosphotransferase [Novosphingobium mathurense]SLJ99121.1 Ser/Thr protein kinase RdoA involved in Cpx stress response, MazF antagonist [Novosphingobium mathurense]
MLIDPTLTTQPPQLTVADAESLAQRIYGQDLKAHELTGERDRNFRMDAVDGSQYLLKVSNPAESPEIVNLQTCVLDHLRRTAPTLNVPHPVKTVDGVYETPIELADGRATTLRMLTFLPGMPISSSVRSTTQRQELGRCLARLDLALQGFSHPAAQHDLLWNVASAHRLNGMIEKISDPERRALVQEFMTHYEATTLPKLASLRAQVIHNDFNLGNVLVDPVQNDEVVAVIDFGDVVYGPLVGEIATAAAYQLGNGDDPMRSAAEMIGAYHELLPLGNAELEVIFDLIVARLVVTVLITEWRAERYPENRSYIMRNNDLAWTGLTHIASFSRNEGSQKLLQFCSSGVQ